MEKKKPKFIDIVSAITVSAAIVCISINIILAFKPLYYYDVGYLHIGSISGMSDDDIKSNYNILIDYLKSDNTGSLILPSFELSRETQIHFSEVKYIFSLIRKLAYILGSLSIIFTFYNFKKRQLHFIKYTSIILLASPLLAIPVLLNFTGSFTIFHKIFFRNDYWLIDPVLDPIIYIFPEKFFLHCMAAILVIWLMSSLILIYAYRYFIKYIQVQ